MPTRSPSTPEDQPDYTIAQAAERKQVSDKTVRRAIAKGELKAYRIGPRLIRIHADSLHQWGRAIHAGGAL